MSAQKKLSELNINSNEKLEMAHILDLEKKYMEILWNLFTSNEFIQDLKDIELEIQRNYNFLQHTWELKNKIKVPAERLTRQYIYKELSHLIKKIYPSAVSSDIAFLTEDAVLNIDIKTLDTVGNAGDIKNLQFENNQSSFINKNLDVDERYPNSGVKVECLLPTKYSYGGLNDLPMLTFFFTIVYSDNGSSFKLCRTGNFETMYLKCLPNGIISQLFDNDIVDNFKTYTYLEHKHGFDPVYLTDDKNLINQKIREYISNNPNFIEIKGRTKTGAYNPNQIHPKYNINGVSWFPVSRQDKINKSIYHYYLEAAYKGNTNRITNNKLLVRYDSHDQEWKGILTKKIEEI